MFYLGAKYAADAQWC